MVRARRHARAAATAAAAAAATATVFPGYRRCLVDLTAKASLPLPCHVYM
jgi:hypothetical protein